MEFTYNGLVRWGFGFHNPNHAAAAICALLPFMWGWGGALRATRPARWVGWALSLALIAALALTYSRTGFLVAALEVIVWAIIGRADSPQAVGRRVGGNAPYRPAHAPWGALLLLSALGVAAFCGGVAMRFAPDASLMNRREIWWAGLKLTAANPLGVGHGHSGLLASTFLLGGIEVRTLVNSHLTLLAELGLPLGGAWVAFIAAALAGGWRRHPRLWLSFAGLTLSAFASSVFDWHVLFGFAEKGGLGLPNFALSWTLFAAYLAMGTMMLGGGMLRLLLAPCLAVLATVAAMWFAPVRNVPRVRGGFVVKRGWDMPLVLRDADWPLKAAVEYLETAAADAAFPMGYRLALAPGYVEPEVPPPSVWLFGTVAESAHRFPGAKITVVDPPEFCPLPPGVSFFRGGL